MTRRRRL